VAGVTVLGIVENMSGYACRMCDDVGPLFSGDAGNRLAIAHAIPLLARLPFTQAPLDDVAVALEPVVDVVLRSRSER
jgi:Mrp family chromosome partitioning ATPase